MTQFKRDDRVQVFDLKEFMCLGWGTVKSVLLIIKEEKQIIYVRLDCGKMICSDDAEYLILSREKAIEVANRMLKDLEAMEDDQA